MISKTDNKWATPVAVSKAKQVFPGSVIGTLLPAMSDLPKKYQDFNYRDDKWTLLASVWFFRGIEGYTFDMKDGIDGQTAFDHLRACIGSFEPKHEHKIVAVAYLMSLWIDDYFAPVEDNQND